MKKFRLVILISVFSILLLYVLLFSIRSPLKNILFPIVFSHIAREILPDPEPNLNTHNITLKIGSNIQGELIDENKDRVKIRVHDKKGKYIDQTLSRKDIFQIDINAKTFPVSASEIVTKKLFPKMKFYRFENYTLFSNGGYSSIGPIMGILKVLYQNLKTTFPEIVSFDEKSNRICVVVFELSKDYEELAASVSPSFAASIGFYSPDHNILFVNNDLSVRRRLASPNDTIRHEGAHQIFYAARLHYGYNVDRLWLVEGIAQYVETLRVGEMSTFRREKVKELIRQNTRYPLRTLLTRSDFMKSKDVGNLYSQSWGLVYFLMEKHEKEFKDYLVYVKKHPFLSKFKGDAKLLEEFLGQDIGAIEDYFKDYWLSN